ncbi:septum formation inhibitor Maf [Candidatus Poribacteria bacterium]|nr:septum formation inhibitor Maf [Candidatus Poribacteria bacterium]
MYKKIILASASPRRRRLLKQIGFEFEVIPSKIKEYNIYPGYPYANAEGLALLKAQDVAVNMDDGIIIGADTQVLSDEEALGKPEDEADAFRMLSKLEGKTHTVITGVALMDAATDQIETWVEETLVKFRSLEENEIRSYIATGEPMGKAGAYGIQGRAAAFVNRIEGCYFNVVGLPLSSLVQKIRKLME